MIDDLREQADNDSFESGETPLDDFDFDDFDDFDDFGDYDDEGGGRRSKSLFLGLTPPQRFLIISMVFLLTIILGAFCLLLTGRVVP